MSLADEGREVALHSVPEGRLPPDLARDLRMLTSLPEGARRDFWTALEPNLASELDERVGMKMAGFCRVWKVTLDDIAPAIKACRFLFRQAAMRDVAPADFGADLAVLLAGNEECREVLSACYDRARAGMRREIARRAIAAHGKLVTGVGFRVDRVALAEEGARIDSPVLFLTLRYREGQRQDQVTVQLLPEEAAELAGLLRDLKV